jgi:PAS domain S-box-containing protein
MCNDISPARADFRRVHDEGTTPAGSPMPWLETDFRQRYNHAVPTDRVSAEVPLGGELIRQEALLDKLFATVPEAIVALDTDDSILRVDPEFTGIFGYAEEEALGRPINELVPEELWAEAEEYTRRGTRGEILNVETMRKRKDGNRVPVSIAGSQISEYVIYRDITERKRAEQRLRQSLPFPDHREPRSSLGCRLPLRLPPQLFSDLKQQKGDVIWQRTNVQ